MEHVSFSDMQMDIVGNISDSPNYQGFSGPSEQIGIMEPVSFNPMFNTSVLSSPPVPNYESGGGSDFSSFWMSAKLVNEDAVILSSITGHEKQLPIKRKADSGLNSYNFVSEHQIFPNNLSVNLADGPSASSAIRQPAVKRSGPSFPSVGVSEFHTQSSSSKKMVRPDAVTGRAVGNRVQPVKRQFSQTPSASKFKQESSESVRSKMRESLAAALALVSPKSDKEVDNRNDHSDATLTQKVSLDSNDLSNKVIVDSNDSGFGSTKGGNIQTSGPEEVYQSTPKELAGIVSHVFPAEQLTDNCGLNGGGTFQQFPYTSMLVDDSQFSDTFIVKDDLLQGNGLSWAFDFDAQMSDGKISQDGDDPNFMGSDANEQLSGGYVPTWTPEDVAFEIEGELFKLFGGVNKKYKEKGRSLLFNLKDRNNPDLRERVMSGEISPEGLCSMSAEELASKELSEWRMAKAEELAQMKVLPDTEVDIRRLVRKTHKGEYQVEFEHDDNIVADLSAGSIISQPQPNKDLKINSPSLSHQAGDASDLNVSDKKYNLGPVATPEEGANSKQEVMVEELKGPEHLPPIVSLDEFMESRNSGSPLEKVSSDSGRKTTVSREMSKGLGKSTGSSTKNSFSKESDASKTREANVASRKGDSPKQRASGISAEDSQYTWEGVLQFSNSSSVTVCGLYKSGEKKSTKQWPSSLEIKGRVRLGAFEKFLQELPMSRTRAVMVLKLELKDKASKTQLSSLSEAIDSYSAEERLGYVEPMPGVEIYLCPPTPRVAELVKHYLPEKASEEGLIGVVVWRRAKSSKQSPNHKQPKKQADVIHNRPPQDSPKANQSAAPSRTPTPVLNNVQHQVGDDDGDVPPGFGPPNGGRDEDDLPEFNFAGQMKGPLLPRIVSAGDDRVHKVRELIQKYGKSGSCVDDRGGSRGGLHSGFEPWNDDDDDDDDDDIPEWRPRAHLQPHHQPYAGAPSGQTAEQLMGGGRWVQSLLRPPPQHGARWRPPY